MKDEPPGEKRPAMSQGQIASAIFIIRDQRVIIDSDLAALYAVETKVLVQAVKRNADRFPSDFMFQVSNQELGRLRSQFVTSKGRGGRRHLPYAFTEQGVAMLSSVLRSKRAVLVNIEIMRAFVRLRAILAGNADLERRLLKLERKYDSQFKAVFDAIRELMRSPTTEAKPPIGFVRHDPGG